MLCFIRNGISLEVIFYSYLRKYETYVFFLKYLFLNIWKKRSWRDHSFLISLLYIAGLHQTECNLREVPWAKLKIQKLRQIISNKNISLKKKKHFRCISPILDRASKLDFYGMFLCFMCFIHMQNVMVTS